MKLLDLLFILIGLGLGLVLVLFLMISPYAQEVPHHGFLAHYDKPELCLACHDGTIAKNITPCNKDSCLFDNKSSHPVFKKYPPTGKESEYAPVFEVEAAGVTLTNGEVTCISCHNLINQQRPHLVMEDLRSRLCKTCHIR